MKKVNYAIQVVNLLKEMAKKYSNQNLSTHLAIALSEYTNFDGISDKELLHALQKYDCEKELDMTVPRDSELDKIIKEGMDLEHILDEEDDDL